MKLISKTRLCYVEQLSISAQTSSFTLALSGVKCSLPFPPKQALTETITTAYVHTCQSLLKIRLLPAAMK